MDPRGKVVLITGASSGIGWETARAFARAGARTALAARRAGKLLELAELNRRDGVEALPLRCDIRRREDVEAAVRETDARFGRLDVLINNAGILEMTRFEEQDLAAIEDVMRVNYLGAVYAIRAALPIMRRQGAGHIVNVASVAGIMGFPYMASYCASKFALVGFTEALRRELYGSGITLTALCPGSVDTPMVADVLHAPGANVPIAVKTAAQIADKIVAAVRSGAPEVVYGEAPGALLRLTKFFPGLTDWAIHKGFERWHPRSRSRKS